MYNMDKNEFISELEKKVDTLNELFKGAVKRREMDTARRLEGKIEGLKLAIGFAKTWLREDGQDA
ncbi:hypothetical protein [Paenibacillus sp. ACRRY]|uniref:hypothetical protein n=1 Tax=Paenibacillus sp. ACRRY TaxID=2918208 RepID=UPI001EF551C0|nr:hypothetical protein [Paenibacillus sp. ACRRY]MCG7385082.1 hypothetical protein [Paenibacillus sp. ACRRY]